MTTISIRLLEKSDIQKIINYWFNKTEEELKFVGVDKNKLGTIESWTNFLEDVLNTPMDQAKAFYLIWQINNEAIGYVTLRNISQNNIADIHLHIWDKSMHTKGYGAKLFAISVVEIYKLFKFKLLLCEPKADNAAPNKMLEKIGFQKWRTYTCASASMCFPCKVNSYIIDLETAKRYKVKN